MNDRRTSRGSWLTVRPATEADLPAVAEMVEGFVSGHPAQRHHRSMERLQEAYFGARPVAHLSVAWSDGRIVGMGQWTRIYDMFWGMFGGEIGWLYVDPRVRGLGIAAAIVAEVCRQVRCAGGEFLHGLAQEDATAALYERVAIGSASRECHLSAGTLQAFADLAGLSPRQIVRQLPAKDGRK